MILVTGHVMVAEGALTRLKPAMEAQLAATRAEEGCIEYTYAVDVQDSRKILVHEKWRDWAALDAHFKKPHMLPWRAALKGAGLSERELRAFEVGDGKEV
ncbi:MAG: putative quinol monooxygenase [Alphaproteobacteria bacterium]